MNDRHPFVGNCNREQDPAYELLWPLFIGSAATLAALPYFSEQTLLQAVERTILWQRLVTQIRQEYAQLTESELEWIRSSCAQISHLQLQLDQLFKQGEGMEHCCDCKGDCCALGHNHLTLANLLTLFVQESELPELDYSQTCPLLTSCGCILSAAQRPYNCISFLCDSIEGQLSPDDIDLFYALEGKLRHVYRDFAERYTGGSMTGLLLVARRLKGKPFLQRIVTA